MRGSNINIDKPAVAIVAITAAVVVYVGLIIAQQLPAEFDEEQLGPSPDACYGLECALRDLPELAGIALVVALLAGMVMYLTSRRRGEVSD